LLNAFTVIEFIQSQTFVMVTDIILFVV